MKEDDKFDELVKEKGEKRKFKYRFFYWLLFARKAGFAIFTTTQIVASIAVVTGLLGAGTAYFVVKNQKTDNAVTFPQNYEPISLSDSTSAQIPDTLAIDTFLMPKLKVDEPQGVIQAKNRNQKLLTDSLSEKGKDRNITQKDTSVLKTKKQTKWKYLQIDPDTIPTNE